MKRNVACVMGILVSEQNDRSPYVRALLRTAEERGVLAYSVTSQALRNPDGRGVVGYGLATGFDYRMQPLPTVVYNRIPTRREEVLPVTMAAKQRLRDQGIPYFNERFFNKREVDRALRSERETSVLLPMTLTEWNPQKVEQWLDEYGALFVKPIAGSLGEGICRASREGTRYRLDTRQGSDVRSYFYTRAQDCVAACKAHLGGAQCIVQEEIPLAAHAGRKTDFRVHVLRTGFDDWSVVAIGAKVGGRNGITTHVHSGGRVEEARLVLTNWYGRTALSVRDELEAAAVNICRVLARRLDENLGEIGLDMGIATDGRLVLFEANAKPGRAIFAHQTLRRAGLLSRIKVIEYAQILTARHSMAGVAQ